MKVLLVAVFLIIFSVGSLLAYGDWSESMGDFDFDNSELESHSSGTELEGSSLHDSSLPLADNSNSKPDQLHPGDLVHPSPMPFKATRSGKHELNLEDKNENLEAPKHHKMWNDKNENLEAPKHHKTDKNQNLEAPKHHKTDKNENFEAPKHHKTDKNENLEASKHHKTDKNENFEDKNEDLEAPKHDMWTDKHKGSFEKFDDSFPEKELPKTIMEEPIMEHYGGTRAAKPIPSGDDGHEFIYPLDEDSVPVESIHTRIVDEEPTFLVNKYEGY